MLITNFTRVAVVLLCALQGFEVRSFRLTIYPEHAHVSSSDPVSVTCSADVFLTDCQFTWLESQHRPGRLLDLSAGTRSNENSSYLGEYLAGYRYSGRGLPAGDCGVTLKIRKEDFWVVGCRVRATRGGWKYAWMDLFVSDRVSPPLNVTPRERIALLGDSVSFSVQSWNPLAICNFRLPGFPGEIIFNGDQAALDVSHFFDVDMHSDVCSITLHNVSAESNGPVLTKVLEPFTWKYAISSLLVASPPSAPLFQVSYAEAHLTATCIVGPSRPVANITWLLDNQVIREDYADDTPIDRLETWKWPWDDVSITQSLTLKVESVDTGKWLTCQVNHMALTQPHKTSRMVVLEVVSSECQDGASCITDQQCTQQIPGSQAFLFYYDRCGIERVNVCCPIPAITTTELTTKWSSSRQLFPDECGLTSNIRIMGGKAADLGQYPWMALLAYEHTEFPSMRQFHCGGTLINRRYVLTAGHCTKIPQVGDPVSVRLGEHDLRHEEDCNLEYCADLPVDIEVELVITHNAFNSSDLKNDIALLRLKESVEETDWVRPICLPFNYLLETEEDEEGKIYSVAGWGKTYYENQTGSPELMSVSLQGLVVLDCNDVQSVQVQPLDPLTQMCAGGSIGMDTCKGDSGGPLMEVIPEISRTYQLGIISFGTHPCGSLVPSIYTRVTGYLDWILSNTKE